MMSGEAGWLRSHDVLAHEIYNNTRPAPGYAHYVATHLQYTSTLHYTALHHSTGVTAGQGRRESSGFLH